MLPPLVLKPFQAILSQGQWTILLGDDVSMDHTRETHNAAKRSLLGGLAVILFLSLTNIAVDVADYRSLSIKLEVVHLPPHIEQSRNSEEQAISEIEDERKMLRIRMATHIGLAVVALWCLNDVLRMGVARVQLGLVTDKKADSA